MSIIDGSNGSPRHPVSSKRGSPSRPDEDAGPPTPPRLFWLAALAASDAGPPVDGGAVPPPCAAVVTAMRGAKIVGDTGALALWRAAGADDDVDALRWLETVSASRGWRVGSTPTSRRRAVVDGAVPAFARGALEWLARRPLWMVAQHAHETAIRAGRRDAVAWLLLRENAQPCALRGSGASGLRAMRAAAAVGCVDTLRWLRERGCDWDGTVAVSAARSDRLEAARWLRGAGCPLDTRVFSAGDDEDDDGLENGTRAWLATVEPGLRTLHDERVRTRSIAAAAAFDVWA